VARRRGSHPGRGAGTGAADLMAAAPPPTSASAGGRGDCGAVRLVFPSQAPRRGLGQASECRNDQKATVYCSQTSFGTSQTSFESPRLAFESPRLTFESPRVLSRPLQGAERPSTVRPIPLPECRAPLTEGFAPPTVWTTPPTVLAKPRAAGPLRTTENGAFWCFGAFPTWSSPLCGWAPFPPSPG